MAGGPQIDSYKFGRIEIDGQTYTDDVIILPDGVRGGWWREEGHRLKVSDLSSVLEASPATLVVGQGAYGRMTVPTETIASLEEAGIETICMPTALAVEIYNERSRRGENLAAALHLTC
ncbi:MAG: hypothetical protein JSV78_06835 [Phycisphaerales bacterium]|nr:MAG: hypothetical protein JSV78_06835 [Phycisphaerales bacterium]